MIEALKELLTYVAGFYIVLLLIVFGLGIPPAIIRRLLGTKRDYWPDTEDVLIGMGLALVIFFVWGIQRR
jgi:hypothetical protein